MQQLTRQLDNLLQKGAVLRHPGGERPLAYAAPAPDWEQLTLLLLEENGLREWKIVPTAKDYDEKTDKLYVAYSDKDYIQIRLCPAGEREANRKRMEDSYCGLLKQLGARAEADSWPAREQEAIQRFVLGSVLEEPWQSYPAARKAAHQLDNRKLGAALLLLNRLKQRGPTA